MAAGTGFNDDRGHFQIGGEYAKDKGVSGYTTARPWGASSDGIFTFPVSRPAGTPSRMFATGLTFTSAPVGGVVYGACTTANCTPTPISTSSPLRGIAFGPGGTVIPFNYGNDTLNTGTAYNFTGDGAPPYLENTMILPVTRYSTMARFDYDVTANISTFLTVNYAHTGSSNFNGNHPRYQSANGIIVRSDNAFLPAALATTMAANGDTAVGIARNGVDFAEGSPDNYNTTTRIVAGASGGLFGSWRWDGYYEYGQNLYSSQVGNVPINNNFNFAQDAVYYNPTNNAILANPSAGIPGGYVQACRALVPGSKTYNPVAAAGCVPLDLLGPNAASQASIDYVEGTIRQRTTTKQQVVSGNVNGTLFDTWAGHVEAAVGGEWRRETASQTVDSLSLANAFAYGNPQPFQGTFSKKKLWRSRSCRSPRTCCSPSRSLSTVPSAIPITASAAPSRHGRSAPRGRRSTISGCAARRRATSAHPTLRSFSRTARTRHWRSIPLPGPPPPTPCSWSPARIEAGKGRHAQSAPYHPFLCPA